ncbi:MAG: peptide deformylase [Candidatus Acidiferrales bacterium]
MNQYDRVLLWKPELVGLPCLPTSAEQCVELNLRQRLLRTCVAYGGVGVAAPQIGVNLRAALINYEDRTILMINPGITQTSGGSAFFEGCLSLPLCNGGRGKHKTYEGGKVFRPDKITVGYQTDMGEEKIETFEGNIAHIVGHEIDHLAGRFYVDHLSAIERDMVFRKFRRFKRYFEVVEEVKV